jgi:hypothetical protein
MVEAHVHTVIITFDLVDMTPDRYETVCAELAPAFAALPGLLAKIWLTDEQDARRGGVYLFRDTASADAFLGSTLARTVATNPHFAGLTVSRYTVDTATTVRTQPGVAIIPSTVLV